MKVMKFDIPLKIKTAERDSRLNRRIDELRKEGMKVMPAAERIYSEEVEAGRDPPTASTIKAIYTHRLKRPPGGKNNFPPA